MGNQLCCTRRIDSDKILLVGLKDSGKQTILKSIVNEGEDITLTQYSFRVKKVKFQYFDIFSFDLDRNFHDHKDELTAIYKKTKVIVFVVDASNDEMISGAKFWFWKLMKLEDYSFQNPYILIFANKQDSKEKLTDEEIIQGLDLNKLQLKWYLQSCSAIRFEGIQQGFAWIDECLKKERS